MIANLALMWYPVILFTGYCIIATQTIAQLTKGKPMPINKSEPSPLADWEKHALAGENLIDEIAAQLSHFHEIRALIVKPNGMPIDEGKVANPDTNNALRIVVDIKCDLGHWHVIHDAPLGVF